MIEGVITHELPILPWFKFYGGLGTNIGYTLNGHMTINGHIDQNEVDNNLERSTSDIFNGNYDREYSYETYDMKNAISQRIFAEVGTGITLFRRLETGFFVRRGVGYRGYFGYGARGVQLYSGGLRMNWIINR